jgi:nicotinamidase-related amidase
MKSKKNIALVIIDFQKAIDHPSWGKRNNPGAEKNIERLLAKCRSIKMQIVHIKHESVNPDSTYRPGQIGCEFKKEVQPLAGEKIFVKHVNSAFIGTELDPWLKVNKINFLIITGVITNNSVEATARMAGNLGYETCVISDAIFTFDKKDYNGILRTAEEVHAMSLSNLEGEYAIIRTTEDVLTMIDELQET